jgi:hypothetical protein
VSACRRLGIRPTRFVLEVSVAAQRMNWWERTSSNGSADYRLRKQFVISTSRFGTGQVENSNQTPLGLHRVAEKIGGGQPIGTVFRSRRPVGLTWDGHPKASIVHRILWLEGLEPGFNRGGNVDTYRRYVYIHGFGDETTLGRPQSRGCIHLAARGLIPLYDVLPAGTLVWIGAIANDRPIQVAR